jgi:hypothetical protein
MGVIGDSVPGSRLRSDLRHGALRGGGEGTGAGSSKRVIPWTSSGNKSSIGNSVKCTGALAWVHRGRGWLDDSDSIATIVAGALALIGVSMGLWASLRIKRMDHRSAEEQRIRAAEATVSRYREPLVSAALDLQARIYNLSTGRFFGEDRCSYHIDHTLYVFAQYLGWREIIREEVQFLDLGNVPATKYLAGRRLEGITSALSVTRPCLATPFQTVSR